MSSMTPDFSTALFQPPLNVRQIKDLCKQYHAGGGWVRNKKWQRVLLYENNQWHGDVMQPYVKRRDCYHPEVDYL